MGSSEHNRGKYLITDWWEDAKFRYEGIFILYHLNITTKLMISQIQFL